MREIMQSKLKQRPFKFDWSKPGTSPVLEQAEKNLHDSMTKINFKKDRLMKVLRLDARFQPQNI